MLLRYFTFSALALAFGFGSRVLLLSQQAAPATPPQTQTIRQPLPEAPSPIGATVAPPSTAPSTAATPSSSFSSSVGSSSAGTPRFWTGKDPNQQVTVLENTLFRVRTNEPLNPRHVREGAPLTFLLSEDVVVDGVLIVPRGAAVQGTVVESRQAGALSGAPELILQLTSLDLAGRTYPLYTYRFKVTGASKTRATELKVKGGAILGAVVGGVVSATAKGETTAVGRLAGAGTGAALGTGVGAAVSIASPGPVLDIPAESEMDFFLASPISVVPATPREAARLSQGLRSGGPALYVRGETP